MYATYWHDIIIVNAGFTNEAMTLKRKYSFWHWWIGVDNVCLHYTIMSVTIKYDCMVKPLLIDDKIKKNFMYGNEWISVWDLNITE